MDKKQYVIPSVSVVAVAVSHILAASGGVSTGSGSGNGYQSDETIDFEDKSDSGFGDVEID